MGTTDKMTMAFNGFIIVVLAVSVIIAIYQRDAWIRKYDDLKKDAITQIQKYDDLKKDAITQGYAQYNPTNGNWEWKR